MASYVFPHLPSSFVHREQQIETSRNVSNDVIPRHFADYDMYFDIQEEIFFSYVPRSSGGRNATPRMMMMEGCGVAMLIGVTGTCVLIRLKKRRLVSVSLILFFPSLYPHLIHLLPRQRQTTRCCLFTPGIKRTDLL